MFKNLLAYNVNSNVKSNINSNVKSNTEIDYNNIDLLIPCTSDRVESVKINNKLFTYNDKEIDSIDNKEIYSIDDKEIYSDNSSKIYIGLVRLIQYDGNRTKVAYSIDDKWNLKKMYELDQHSRDTYFLDDFNISLSSDGSVQIHDIVTNRMITSFKYAGGIYKNPIYNYRCIVVGNIFIVNYTLISGHFVFDTQGCILTRLSKSIFIKDGIDLEDRKFDYREIYSMRIIDDYMYIIGIYPNTNIITLRKYDVDDMLFHCDYKLTQKQSIHLSQTDDVTFLNTMSQLKVDVEMPNSSTHKVKSRTSLKEEYPKFGNYITLGRLDYPLDKLDYLHLNLVRILVHLKTLNKTKLDFIQNKLDIPTVIVNIIYLYCINVKYHR